MSKRIQCGENISFKDISKITRVLSESLISDFIIAISHRKYFIIHWWPFKWIGLTHSHGNDEKLWLILYQLRYYLAIKHIITTVMVQSVILSGLHWLIVTSSFLFWFCAQMINRRQLSQQNLCQFDKSKLRIYEEFPKNTLKS